MLEDFDEGSDYDMMPPTRAVISLGQDEHDDGRAVHRIGLGSMEGATVWEDWVRLYAVEAPKACRGRMS